MEKLQSFKTDFEEQLYTLYNLTSFKISETEINYREGFLVDCGFKVDCTVQYYDIPLHYWTHIPGYFFENKELYERVLYSEVMRFGDELYKVLFGKD